MSKFYHVIKKQGRWHLYAGNALTALLDDVEQSIVVKAARSLARHNRARVVVHKDHSTESAVTRAGTLSSEHHSMAI